MACIFADYVEKIQKEIITNLVHIVMVNIGTSMMQEQEILLQIIISSFLSISYFK